MGYITANGKKLAKINDDGLVISLSGKHLGRVNEEGHVLTTAGKKVGHVDHAGKIYDLDRYLGSVHGDGAIYDNDGEHLAHAEPPHSEFGGAAYLLLIR